MEDHLRAVRQVLEEIDASEIPALKVFNKIDQISDGRVESLLAERAPSVAVSAKTGAGLEDLLARVDEELASTRRRVTLSIPQGDAGLVAQVHEHGRVLDTRYEDNTVVLDAEIEPALAGKLEEYIRPA